MKKYFFQNSRNIDLYRIACETIPVLIFCYLAYLVISQATNIPFWDQWGLSLLFEKYYEKSLSFEDFSESSGGHILIFPKLIWLFMGLMTSWDVRYELFVNLFLGALIYCYYRFFICNTLNLNNKIDFLVIPIIGVFIFSLKQWENWTWGYQIQIFLCVLCGIMTIGNLVLYKASIATTALAAITAFISTFSFAAGVNVWIVGLVLLISKRNIFSIFLWILLSTICFLMYLWKNGYIVLSLDRFYAYIKFIYIFIGTPLSADNNNFALFCGIFGILASELICFSLFIGPNRKHPAVLFFSSVILFIILAAILTSFSRAHVVTNVGAESRYTGFSIHFWISFICLVIFYIKETQVHHAIKYFYISAILFIVFASANASISSIAHFYRYDERSKLINSLKENGTDDTNINFGIICWNNDYLFSQINILKKHHLSFYAEK